MVVIQSGAPLTNPGDHMSSRELGAIPKVGHGGRCKVKKVKGKGDVWHNHTRKSAKSLRGQGQFLVSAARKGDDEREEEEDVSGLVAVRREGPQGSHRARGKKRPSNSLNIRDELRNCDSCDKLLRALISIAVVLGGSIAFIMLPLDNVVRSVIYNRGSMSTNKSPDADQNSVVVSLICILISIVYCVIAIKYVLSSSDKDKKRKR
ncbi:hypothetical protein [Candidatus Ichthyocystis sparus]|uniref:hypothetical protein n=1 Tax=Candidatus Ichthyocystis sparus TaxID=1561004 RepID=UPI000B88F3B4|nr:hypothetical protein [Candidatus Ichthyocystis sparus]